MPVPDDVLVPCVLPTGEPQLAPEDSLPLFEVRQRAAPSAPNAKPGGRGHVEPLAPVSAAWAEARRRSREAMWAAAEAEERALEEAEERERAAAPTAKQEVLASAASPAAPASTTGKGKDKEGKKSVQWSEVDHIKEFDHREAPSSPAADAEASFSQPAKQAAPVRDVVVERPTAPPAPAGPSKPPVVKAPIVKDTVFERPTVPPRAPGAPSLKGKEKETPPHMVAAPAAPTPSPAVSKLAQKASAAPIIQSTIVERPSNPPAPPTAPSKGPIVKPMVVERPPAPPKPPQQPRKPAFGKAAREAKAQAAAAAAAAAAELEPSLSSALPPPTRPPSIASTAPEPTPATAHRVPAMEPIEDEDDDEFDDEDDDDGSYELSSISDHSSDAEGGDYESLHPAEAASMEMDQKLMMREAAVSYYRLKGALASRGGLEGLLRGMGEGGSNDEPEFVPIDATLASDLDEVRLAAPEKQSSASKFASANSNLSSIPLPTLVPGGSAQGVLKGAIRVGRLENGKLVVGGDDTDESEDEGDEVEQAGKEALMWGMVGGVVVRPEDLAEGAEGEDAPSKA